MSYKKNVVKKPWGYEYLVYENEHVALWFLSISKDQKTSMHCHPNKTTGLMVIDGNAEVSFLSNKIKLKAPEKVMIRKGLFHSTQAIDSDLSIFEIETPVNKHDLVRLEDKYGRTGQPYEDSSKELPKAEECVWIDDPTKGANRSYNFEGTKITVHHLSDMAQLLNLLNKQIAHVMFLRGGILTDYGVNVAGPGDVVANDVLMRLLQVFHNLAEETVILIHEGEFQK